VYVSHLLNRLLTTVIRGKTPLEMVCLEYLVVRHMLMSKKICSKANKLVFLRYKEDLKGYKL